jgi:carboxymethylenebutenolidase
MVSRLCPVVGSYPEKDFTTNAGRNLDQALDKHHIAHDVKIYPGAEHSFMNENAASYNEAAAKDSWARVLKFFGEQIGPKKTA